MAEGRGSLLQRGLRLISLGLLLTTAPPHPPPHLQITPGLPGCLQLFSAGPSRSPREGPNRSSSIRAPSGLRLRSDSADGGPAPLLPGLRAAPPRLAAAMLTSGERSGDRKAPQLRALLSGYLPSSVTPEEFSLALHAPQSPAPAFS